MLDGSTVKKSEVTTGESVKIISGKEKMQLTELERLYHMGRQFRAEKKLLEEFQRKHEGKLDATKSLVLKWVLQEKTLEDKDFNKADSVVADFIRGRRLLEDGRYSQAGEILSKLTNKESGPTVGLLLVEAHIKQHNYKKAEEVLHSLEKHFPSDLDVQCQRGYLSEINGDWEKALNIYDKVLAVAPNHARANFRAASLYDLRGEDEKARELYKVVAGGCDCFSGALLNLGLMLEDEEEYEAALECYRRVLNAYPANKLAKLYFRNVEGALEMYYDETEEKESEKSMQILRTPITDFELSVRSRNCLNKMQIRTLGDLVKKTESELLSYKNFGETSLREIKELLKQRTLRLGMGSEEERRRKREIKRKMMSDDKQEGSDILNESVSKLQLSVRARKCMENLGVTMIGELTIKSERELLSVENFGQTSLNELKRKLEELGLKLKDSD